MAYTEQELRERFAMWREGLISNGEFLAIVASDIMHREQVESEQAEKLVPTQPPAYVWQAFDVMQIKDKTGAWLDFATLKLEGDGVTAVAKFVPQCIWNGELREFRITRDRKVVLGEHS